MLCKLTTIPECSMRMSILQILQPNRFIPFMVIVFITKLFGHNAALILFVSAETDRAGASKIRLIGKQLSFCLITVSKLKLAFNPGMNFFIFMTKPENSIHTMYKICPIGSYIAITVTLLDMVLTFFGHNLLVKTLATAIVFEDFVFIARYECFYFLG